MGCLLLLFRIVLCFHLLFFHFPSFSPSSLHSSAPLCHPDQSSALLQFKNSFHVNTTNASYNCEQLYPKTIRWENGTDCCSWMGVSCDSMSGHVIGLDLRCSGLEGKIHPNSTLFRLTHLRRLNLASNGFYWSQLSSPLSFSNLTLLTYLDLSWNELSGSIPSSLSNLQHLTYLDLSWNELSGSIPSSLSNLQHLTYLDLSHNILTDSIPSSFLNLQHLIHLNLSCNQLNGQIPDVLGGLTRLQTLNLGYNNLGGQLPSSLFNLTQLSWFDCSFNKFEGSLPDKITGFSYLIDLYLNDNLLNGIIPSWCLSLPSLTYLYLTNNRFTGHIGAITSSSLLVLNLCGNELLGNIPESIFNLVNLTYLCLSSDNYDSPIHFSLFSKLQNLQFLSLSGYNSLSLKIEINSNHSFPQLTTLKLFSNNLIDHSEVSGKFPSLENLELSNSKLREVPKWIRDMDSLLSLKLSHNLLTSMDQFPWYNLEILDLSSNLMTGEISSFICNATCLTIVNLSHNKFTGTFPQCLANFSSIEVLDLQMNKLHGTLPDSMNWDLRTLDLNGNQLEGLLPKSLSNCTELEYLNLGSNQMEDTFPHWLENLQYLQILVLRANKLYGSIVSLKNNQSFPSLIFFDISYNNFSGPLPKDYIKKFQTMKSVVQAEGKSILEYMGISLGVLYSYWGLDYDNSLIATIKGVSTTFEKISTVFVNIDLSKNNFEGEIPNVIGELHGLKGLNLSHNRLNGSIPHSIGNLTNLEWLDLSSNMLTGGIPIELTNLNSLAVLNLSQNHLVGQIPKGNQFDTFLNDSYEGNIGLCGLPLSVQCNKGPEQQSPSSPTFEVEEKFGFGWKPVAIGYGCGMVFGIGLGCCVLLIGKPLWLVRMVGGGPNKRVKSRRRGTRTHGNCARMN